MILLKHKFLITIFFSLDAEAIDSEVSPNDTTTLQKRGYYCDSGYGLCQGNYCCPLGGQCCIKRRCCGKVIK